MYLPLKVGQSVQCQTWGINRLQDGLESNFSFLTTKAFAWCSSQKVRGSAFFRGTRYCPLQHELGFVSWL